MLYCSLDNKNDFLLSSFFFQKQARSWDAYRNLFIFKYVLYVNHVERFKSVKNFYAFHENIFKSLLYLPHILFSAISIFLSFIYMYIYQETHFTDSNRENKITSQVIYNFCWIIFLLHVWQI